MIQTILLITGALVWLLIGATLALWLPPVVAWLIGWLSYKTRYQLWIRDRAVSFIGWYGDHVLKPIFDPILG